MFEYRQIIYRLQQGQSHRAIARDGLASRTKIKEVADIAKLRGWLEPSCTLPDEQTLAKVFFSTKTPQQLSKVQRFSDLIEQWVKDDIQASVMYLRLKEEYQFDGAYNSVQRFVCKIKQTIHSNLTVPLHFSPAEATQVDFGQGPKIYDERTGREKKLGFFVMTLCWSRHQYVELVTHQDVQTWLNCHPPLQTWRL